MDLSLLEEARHFMGKTSQEATTGSFQAELQWASYAQAVKPSFLTVANCRLTNKNAGEAALHYHCNVHIHVCSFFKDDLDRFLAD